MQFRDLPSVDRVMASDGMAALTEAYPRDWVVELVRRELDSARQKIRDGGKAPSAGDVVDGVSGELRSINEVAPRQVINATGVIIHTNLGRAPLSPAAVDAMTQAARGYTDLEMDLSTGRRGSRQAHLQSLLQQVTGAEAAMAVNNNASALLLGRSAMAAGKEVIVSRGEAVEIGGGFRIPDVLKQSGVTLVDVGTTNRTYVRDYEDAITENTAVMLKVHSSNFRVEGFTAEVEPSELVALSKEKGIPVLHDVGSGALLPTEAYGLAHEPIPQQSIAAGIGLVFFSGDKLLGGPQSGIVVGQTELVRRLERHPLARAVRIDKMSLAGLTATVLHYLKQEAETEIPVWKMISANEQGIKDRAVRWKTQLSIPGEVISGRSAVGGGSLPGETLPTWLLAIPCGGDAGGPERVMRRLREANPPVVARIEDDRVILDPRTVMPEEEEALLTALREAFAG